MSSLVVTCLTHSFLADAGEFEFSDSIKLTFNVVVGVTMVSRSSSFTGFIRTITSSGNLVCNSKDLNKGSNLFT